ncbi:MAG: reprolysin-like metallopeptidase [Thermoanaerobaculia bacterium]
MRMRDLAIPAAAVLFVLVAPLAATVSPFRDLDSDTARALPARGGGDGQLPVRFRTLAVDTIALDDLLRQAPMEGSVAAIDAPLLFALPYPDGSDRLFRVVESPIMESGLAARFPEVRTYAAQGVDDTSATARLSVTELGFHGMVLSTAGTIYIDPWRKWEAGTVISYYQRDARRSAENRLRCEVTSPDSGADASELAGSNDLAGSATSLSTGPILRTYRLALAGTAEYTAAVCAPNPAGVSCGLNAMVVSMNRVDGIYEREVAVRMVLIANNNVLVFTDTATDGYSNGNPSSLLSQNQTKLDAVIGSANYDIGHVFSTAGGGLAGLGVVCAASQKARGETGTSSPSGDGFDVDYVAHEMGHQFGGDHTFNGTTNSCGGGNRSGSSAYEPGSASTIMGYAGICGTEDLQPHSDDTFHARSFDQIVTYTTSGGGNACPVQTATGNLPPSPNAGADFTIPKSTPFTLTGTATDPDSDPLTFMWEEFDLGTAAPPNTDVAAVRPIFRSFVPLAVPSRTFPRLSDILNNVVTFGESMSTRARTMTFRLTARDNRVGGGGVNVDTALVTVDPTSGPFGVTSPNAAVVWGQGSSQSVTWNVANTAATPVLCTNVAIDLSVDGGLTFASSLIASTANDGAESVTVPATPTAQARIRVSCVGNIFFDISNVNFTISAAAPAPELSSLLPATGSMVGGTVVTLTGSNFVSGATVSFDGIAATGVSFNSSTSLTATTPAHAPGVVDVTVKNPDLLTDTLAASFTYFLDLPFLDGFESTDTSHWSLTVP